MQIGNFIRAEQSPFTLFFHSLHEQIWNPVRRVHVMSSTTIVPGVLAEIKEFLDIHVPGFKVRADSPFALSALIDGYGRVVHDLQKRNHTLAATIRALNVGIRRTDAGPVVAKTTCPFAELRVVGNALEDVFQIVLHGRQVT
jgi:hypothetical protein